MSKKRAGKWVGGSNPNVKVLIAIDKGYRAQLQAIKHRDGIPVSEQVRRGIALWLALADGLGGKPKRSDTK